MTDLHASAAETDDRDVAPGLLRLIQSFANTVSTDDEVDLLGTREEAATWLRTAVLLPAEAGLSNSEHAALLRLRDSLRDILTAHTEAREDTEAAARLTKALADGRLVLIIEPASTVQLASAARASYAHVVAAFAVAIAKTAAAGAWLGLKTCSDPHCGVAFYSASAGTGRCSRHDA